MSVRVVRKDTASKPCDYSRWSRCYKLVSGLMMQIWGGCQRHISLKHIWCSACKVVYILFMQHMQYFGYHSRKVMSLTLAIPVVDRPLLITPTCYWVPFWRVLVPFFSVVPLGPPHLLCSFMSIRYLTRESSISLSRRCSLSDFMPNLLSTCLLYVLVASSCA